MEPPSINIAVPIGGIVNSDGTPAGANSIPQYQFISDITATICGLWGGNRCGKTASAIAKHVELALINGNPEARTEGEFLVSVYVLPTYQMCRDIALPYFQSIFSAIEKLYGLNLMYKPYNKTEHEFTLVNGHKIRLRSADRAEKLQGPTYTHATADEICLWSHSEAWYYLITRAVSDNRARVRQINYVATPEIGHWAEKEVAKRGIKIPKDAPEDDRYPTAPAQHRWYHATMMDNVALPPEQLALMAGNLSKRLHEQIVLGLFVSAVGRVFGEFERERYKWRPRAQEAGYLGQGTPVYIGIDPGQVFPTAVFLAPDRERKGNFVIIHEIWENEIKIEELLDRIDAICKTRGWRIMQVGLDPNDANTPEIALLINNRLRVFPRYSRDPAYKSVRLGWELLHIILEDRDKRRWISIAPEVYRDADLFQDQEVERGIVGAFENLRYMVSRRGEMSEKIRRDKWIHIIDAFRYIALWVYPELHTNVEAIMRTMPMGGIAGEGEDGEGKDVDGTRGR